MTFALRRLQYAINSRQPSERKTPYKAEPPANPVLRTTLRSISEDVPSRNKLPTVRLLDLRSKCGDSIIDKGPGEIEFMGASDSSDGQWNA
ncbi:hypothetical protein WA026_005704 [Henosepilachna vigintioctopunctata]|uniref:Uncharacterized protein n=1 Tax=Henosepilachna vigintioctopunctata TaxID=420089 RepID=A0AAW1U3P5_9CUCU